MSIGMSGPVTSASTRPTEPSSASTQARFAATLDLPTPPFPDMTTILCWMWDMRCAIFMPRASRHDVRWNLSGLEFLGHDGTSRDIEAAWGEY